MLTLVVCLCIAGTLVGSIALATVEGGDEDLGKELAKARCKHCHIQGAEAGTMTALSKTRQQWERFFNKRRHNKIAPGAWDPFTDKELKDILQFMYNHAADSDQPATCGE